MKNLISTYFSTPNHQDRRSIRTLLLLAVNLPIMITLAVLLPVDYRREMKNALIQQHANREEEAMTIHHGFLYLIQNGQQISAQKYINTICSQMVQSRSPGHHIIVSWDDNLIQAQAHSPDSPEMLQVMQQAVQSPNHRAVVGNETLVVGSFADSGIDVFVSEYATNIRRSIRSEIYVHLGSLIALAFVAAAIVNFVLWKIVATPVQQLVSTVGRIAKGDYNVTTDAFYSREFNKLSIAIQEMSRTLDANERDRQAQLDRARRIQEHLLPNGVEVPSLKVAHLYLPAEEVAGDYYDLIHLPDDTWLVCVGDISGHGIGAAMGSVMLKTLVIHAAKWHQEPREILKYINVRLPVLMPEEFTTMFLARWYPEDHRLNYVSAGHEPGLLLSLNGDFRELRATGLPLGVDPTFEWDSETIDFSPGQRLLLTTDGVAESTSPDGELLGRKCLAELFANCANNTPEVTVASLKETILRHQSGDQAADDVTIMLLADNRHLS